MKKTTYLRFVALLLAALVVSMPYTFAQTLTITKNSGQDNLQKGTTGYLREFDDVWTLVVNAFISGQTISPYQVKVNGFDFDSCEAALSGFDCLYHFDYSDNHLNLETEVPLVVDLYDASQSQVLVSKSASVVVDGTGPSFNELNIYQGAGQTAKVEMTLKDEPEKCAGLGKIEIYDAGTNILLKTIKDSELAGQITAPCGENQLSFDVAFPSAGSMAKTGRVIAYDKLGNRATASDEFTYDYRSPAIFVDSLMLDNFGNYIPSGAKVVDVYLNVSEDGEHLTAQATSSDWGWVDEEAVCTKTDHVNHIFTCVWQNKNVQMSASPALSVTISDGANTLTQSVSKNFIIDAAAPEIDFFGAGEFEGVSYLGPKDNTIKVIFDESQSGLDQASVKADLGGIYLFGAVDHQADNCSKTSSTQWACFWYDLDDVQSGSIYLVSAADKVGNEVYTAGVAEASADLVFDNVEPVISDVEILALGPEGPVGFYQSGDLLQIKFTVSEAHGVLAKVDLNDAVNSFAGVTNENGLVKAACAETADNFYECAALSPKIKSGHAQDVEIRIIAADMAGNTAEKTEKIEILGIANEANPDYWKLGSVSASPASLDIKTVPYINQRVFFSVPLIKKNAKATLLGVSLADCTGDTDKLADSFMVGNMFGSAAPQLVLELNAFTPDQDLHFNCTLNVFSRLGNQVVANPEKESAALTVSFFETDFDSQQDTLDKKIKDAKDNVKVGFWKVIAVLNDIVELSKLFCTTKDALHILDFMWNVLQGESGMDALRSNPYTASTAISACYTSGTGEDLQAEGDDIFTKYCKIISCDLSLLDIGGELFDTDLGGEWYSKTVTTNFQNYKSLGLSGNKKYQQFQNTAGVSASGDPYDSLVVALAYLCLPAIIYNLEKYRQIECRYIGCLENEVKAGVVNINGCKELKKYQTCKYVVGELFELVPFASLLNAIVSKIQGMLKDPVGLLRLAFGLLCADFTCPTTNLGKSICVYGAFLFAALDLINDVLAIVSQAKQINADYCSEIGLKGIW